MTAVSDAPPVSRFLPFGAPDGPVRLYCLPHAGAAASSYRSWTGRIGPVAVRPVQLAGRETRLNERAHDRMAPLVDELADVVLTDADRPYAVYGHSLGALIGFELLCEIRRRGGSDPVHFVVSGSPAPHRTHSAGHPRVADMTDAQVVDLLRSLGGTPELFLTDPTMLRMILPRVRADFGIRDSYTYRPQAPLTVPITTLASTDDPRADVEAMRAWRELTLGRFQQHILVGGHFAVLEQPHITHAHLRRALSADGPDVAAAGAGDLRPARAG